MLKQVFAFVLLAAFATQTFNRAFIVFDYYVNSKSYAKNCENKARPQMHCNGKCQMMKKLKQEEKKDQQNPDRRAEYKNELLFFSKSYLPHIQGLLSQEHNFFTPCSLGNLIAMPRSVFHPPNLIG